VSEHYGKVWFAGIFCRHVRSHTDEPLDDVRSQQQRPVSSDVSVSCHVANAANDLSGGDNQHLTGDLTVGIEYKSGLANQTTATTAEPLIVHAGAVVSMLHLLPSIGCHRQPQVVNIGSSFIHAVHLWC